MSSSESFAASSASISPKSKTFMSLPTILANNDVFAVLLAGLEVLRAEANRARDDAARKLAVYSISH